MSPRRSVAICLIFVVGMASASCAWFETVDPETAIEEPRVYSQLVIVSGDSQSGSGSSSLPLPLVVRYYRVTEASEDKDRDSTVAQDVVIDWSVVQGGGSLNLARTSTGENGETQNTWILGTGLGTQTVRATVNGTTVSVEFTATAGTPPPPPPPPGIASMSITPENPTVQVQQSVQLTATVILQQGAVGTPSIQWSSADVETATVSQTGSSTTITAKKVGEVDITATATLGTSTATRTTRVTVIAAPQPIQVRVQVNGSGTGSGQVTSTGIPGGDISCTITAGATSGACQATFSDTDGKGSVTLAAAASGNSTFGTWGGCGEGSSGTTCVIPYDATSDVTLTATVRFDPPPSQGILGVDEMIVFANDSDGEFMPSPSQIWVMTNTSTAVVTSGNGINTEPAWSPDGSRIVFRTKITNPKGDIWTMNANGTSAALLSGSIDFDHDPDWSSTNRVVWVSDRRGDDNLYMVDVSNPNTVIELTLTFGVDELDPVFSPDGSKIAYVRDDFTGASPIWVMNVDGTGHTQLTNGAEDEDPTWSPDGTRIAFVRNDHIWIMNANGSGLTRLTTEGNNGSPAFSPDGTKLAFTRGPTNAKRIWVLFLGSSTAPVTLGPNLPGESEDLDWIKKP